MVSREAEASAPGGDSVVTTRRAACAGSPTDTDAGDTMATSGGDATDGSSAEAGTAGTGALVARQQGGSSAADGAGAPALALGIAQRPDASSQQHACDAEAAFASGRAGTEQSATGAQGASASAVRTIVAQERMAKG